MGSAASLLRAGGAWHRPRLPDTLFALDEVPHSWLFPRLAAVVHHGGAGTTAAALAAGKPSIVCPYFHDQPFWGERIRDLGAGPPPIPQRELTADRLAEAIRIASTDVGMRQRAEAVGEKIRRGRRCQGRRDR